MTTPTAEGLTPDLFGYARCARCETWRPETALTCDSPADWSKTPRCVDSEWCDRQVGRATGIDSNGDAQ